MLFRILIIIAIFYLVRTIFRQFFAGEGRTRTFARREEKRRELDLSQYDIEDVEYQDLEDD
jgi:uncharacterized protein HemY